MPKEMVKIPLECNAATAQRLFALEVLRQQDGDRTKTARALDVDPSTLRKWMASLEVAGVKVPKAKHGRPLNLQGRGPVRILVPSVALPTPA